MSAEFQLTVDDLHMVFSVRSQRLFRRDKLRAVRGVTFGIRPGETLGLVGESGSGKSTVANIVSGLLKATSGTVTIGGVDHFSLSARKQREHRRHVQIVFQDPYSSMAPTVTVESSIVEPLRAHGIGNKDSRRGRVDELLDQVGLDHSLKSRYPSQLSGGQLQRVSIARALALDPMVLVLDEPVSALDVSTKAEIINLLADLKDRLGLTYLFISHDLSTLRVLADRIAVMYLGEIVEDGPADEVYDRPRHPYTRALLASVPVPDPVVQRQRERIVLEGDIPSPVSVPSGCTFHNRCPHVMDVCRDTVPPLTVEGGVALTCHLYTETHVSAPGS